MKRMKKLKEILKISTFFAVAIIISMVWLFIEAYIIPNPNLALSDLSNFILLLLGYGEVSRVNDIGKIIVSVISIIEIALISALFTVNLFDWRHRVKISSD